MGWLRRIRGRSRREKIRNEVTRKELEIEETLVEKIRRRRLKWFGHVERMNKERLPLLALHGHIEGDRSRNFIIRKLTKRRKEAVVYESKALAVSQLYKSIENHYKGV